MSSNSAGRAAVSGPPLLRSLATPARLTLALVLALYAAGAYGLTWMPTHSLLPGPTGAVGLLLALVLGVCFLLTEVSQAPIEFFDEAYSFSLSGIPMVLGLLYCPPGDLVVARTLAAVLAFAIQRTSPVKCAFNVAVYLLDSVLVLGLAHHLLGPGAVLGARTALLSYLVLAAVDLAMSVLVLLVIRINAGPLAWRDAVSVFAPASLFVAVSTATGFVFAELLTAGVLGVSLLLMLVVVTVSTYRAYLVLRRRHRSLEVVQQFIEDTEGDNASGQLATRMLERIRELVRASRVELVIRWPEGRQERHEAHAEDAPVRPGPGLVEHLPADAELVDGRSGDPAQRAWLAGHGLRNAAVVRLNRSGVVAVLVAVDRQGGEVETFSRDDQSLMQALVGHLAVALTNRLLVEELRHENTHDSLTGLANRALLTDRLHHQLLSVGDGDVPAADGGSGRPAVVLMDLDRFKEVNDTLGHPIGDQLLTVIADRLLTLAIPGATIARLGGDEFALLLPQSTTCTALQVAEQVQDALRAPVHLLDTTVSTSAGIGVALADGTASGADLLRHADTAMYAAKREGGRPVLYRPELDSGRAERLALLGDLHAALDAEALQVHYQAKLDLASSTVTGMEALVRWTHPVLGPLRPDVFVPLAESTGLIDRLTRSVLLQALRQCRTWREQGHDLAVAVNLSPRNLLAPDLVAEVSAALALTGVPAHRLTLEITESAVMAEPERAIAVLHQLAAQGVRLSLDDFGTGHSSLAYLQRLPVRELKIDQSFVRGLSVPSSRQASLALVRCIVMMASSLGLQVVAEGVEDPQALEDLRDLGAQTIQGYHVSRPQPPDRLPQHLAAGGPGRPPWRVRAADAATQPHPGSIRA